MPLYGYQTVFQMSVCTVKRQHSQCSIERFVLKLPNTKPINNKLTRLCFITQHHCRSCGKIVCGGCSKNNYPLLNISTKPVRVCDSCFSELNTKRVQQNNGVDRKMDESSDSDSECKNNRESGKSLEDLNIDEKVSAWIVVMLNSLSNG